MALSSLNARNRRAQSVVSRVVSYLFDFPEVGKDGSVSFVKRALADPRHPARQHRVHPTLSNPYASAFIRQLADHHVIVYDA